MIGYFRLITTAAGGKKNTRLPLASSLPDWSIAIFARSYLLRTRAALPAWPGVSYRSISGDLLVIKRCCARVFPSQRRVNRSHVYSFCVGGVGVREGSGHWRPARDLRLNRRNSSNLIGWLRAWSSLNSDRNGRSEIAEPERRLWAAIKSAVVHSDQKRNPIVVTPRDPMFCFRVIPKLKFSICHKPGPMAALLPKKCDRHVTLVNTIHF